MADDSPFNFQRFERGVRFSRPSARVDSHGQIQLTRAAREMIDSDSVVLMADTERRVVALKPCDPDDPNGYPIRSTNSSSSVVSSRAMLNAFGLLPEHSVACEIELVGGVFVMHLPPAPPVQPSEGEPDE